MSRGERAPRRGPRHDEALLVFEPRVPRRVHRAIVPAVVCGRGARRGRAPRRAVGARRSPPAAVRVGEPALRRGGSCTGCRRRPDGSGGAVLYAGGAGEPRGGLAARGLAALAPLPLRRGRVVRDRARGSSGVDRATQRLGVVDPGAFTPIADAPMAGGPVADGPIDDVALGDPVRGPWHAVGRSPSRRPPRRGRPGAGSSPSTSSAAHGCAGRRRRSVRRAPGRPRRHGGVAWLEWPRRRDALGRRGDLGRGARRSPSADRRVPRRRAAWTAGAARRRASPRGDPTARSPTCREAAGYWQPWVCDDGGGVAPPERAPRGVPATPVAHLPLARRPRAATARSRARSPTPTASTWACSTTTARSSRLDQPCVRVDGVARRRGRARHGWARRVAAQGAVCAMAAAARRRGRPRWRSLVEPPRRRRRRSVAPERFSFAHDGVALDGRAVAPTDGCARHRPRRRSSSRCTPGRPARSTAPTLADRAPAHLDGLAVCAVDVSGLDRARPRAPRAAGRPLRRARRRRVRRGGAPPRRRRRRRPAARVRPRHERGRDARAPRARRRACSRGAVAWYPASSFEDAEEGFEAGYLGALLGPGASDRSPLARAARLSRRALVVQGERRPDRDAGGDRVAARRAARRARRRRVRRGARRGPRLPHRGGRAAALEAELAFYRRHLADRAARHGPGARVQPPDHGRRRAGPRPDEVAGSAPAPRYDAGDGGPCLPAT